uniref:DUF3456 domain-containing protein n=1 Tax=Panagrellus redivivus TaxID=6233 RepID=A0A7E4UZ78_PANRE
MLPKSLALLLALFVAAGNCTEETSLKCGACLLLINEFESAIAAIDPKKTTTIGSYRVDPKGNQKGLVEIPYARSEVHLNEVLDTVCDVSKKYTQAVHPTTGKKTYVHEDKVIHYKRIPAKTSKLNSACQDIIDDHETDLIKFLQNANEDPVREFCHRTLGLCTSVDVTAFPEEKEEAPETAENAATAENNDEL